MGVVILLNKSRINWVTFREPKPNELGNSLRFIDQSNSFVAVDRRVRALFYLARSEECTSICIFDSIV